MKQDIFKDAVKLLTKLGQQADINEGVINIMSHPEFFINVNYPVKMDNNKIRIFKAYRSRYSTALGIGKGGIRFSPHVGDAEVNSLALWMTIKNSLMNLPYGGAKGGVIVDPGKLSEGELERVARGYVKATFDVIGERIDVPAPDMGTNAKIISWMMDEYNIIKREHAPGTFTGKPVYLGGSLFRNEATGYGAFIVSDLLRKKIKKDASDIKVAVQGLGNVGYHLSQFLSDAGYKVVAISDRDGGLYNENGLDLSSIYKRINPKDGYSRATFEEIKSTFPEYEVIENQSILELEVDMLFPSAVENVITKENVDNIKAKYIIEAANGPVQPDAGIVLEDKGVIIVPDVLVNAGGVVVSYFEWLQNLSRYYWKESEVKDKLTEMMTNAFNEIWTLKENKDISMRSSAYEISLKRLESIFKFKYNL